MMANAKKASRKQASSKKSALKSAIKKTATKKRASGNGNIAPEITRTSIEFHYIKGVGFRSVHVDGAIGGLTTKGFIHMAVFAERDPLPRKTTFSVTPEGILGEEDFELREGKEGVIRQMEVDLIMNEATAIDMRNWLDARIIDLQTRQKDLEEIKKGSGKK